MIHYVNTADPLQSITLGLKLATATPVGDLPPSTHKNNNQNIFLNHEVNISGEQLSLIKPLVSSPKHVVPKVTHC